MRRRARFAVAATIAVGLLGGSWWVSSRLSADDSPLVIRGSSGGDVMGVSTSLPSGRASVLVTQACVKGDQPVTVRSVTPIEATSDFTITGFAFFQRVPGTVVDGIIHAPLDQTPAATGGHTVSAKCGATPDSLLMIEVKAPVELSSHMRGMTFTVDHGDSTATIPLNFEMVLCRTSAESSECQQALEAFMDPQQVD